MSKDHENQNMAVFCDFENVAIGVREARFEEFDISKVIEKLLLKGSIVVKKAYCDWERYKEFKAAMHEAAFELIEIPHVRQSGKNSADIRMVVDALDLCYTKLHVDTFPRAPCGPRFRRDHRRTLSPDRNPAVHADQVRGDSVAGSAGGGSRGF